DVRGAPPADVAAYPARFDRTPGGEELNDKQLDKLVGGAHHDPHSILGAHASKKALTVPALRPCAAKVSVEIAGRRHEMAPERHGIWKVEIPGVKAQGYRLLVDYGDGYEHRQDDAYRYLPSLG